MNRLEFWDFRQHIAPKRTSVYSLSIVQRHSVCWTIDEFRNHLRLDDVTQDPTLQAILNAAIAKTEADSGYSLSVSTMQAKFDLFPNQIQINIAPVSEILTFTYRDVNNVVTDFTGYFADLNSRPLRIDPQQQEAWPSTWGQIGDITITFKTAVTSQDDLKIAALLLAAHWYENREESSHTLLHQIPMGYNRIIDSHRLVSW